MFTGKNKYVLMLGILLIASFLAWRVSVSSRSTVLLRGITIKTPALVPTEGKWAIVAIGCGDCREASKEQVEKAEEAFAMLLENRSAATWMNLDGSRLEGPIREQLVRELGQKVEDCIFIADASGKLLVAHGKESPAQQIASDLRNLIFSN